MGDNARGRDDAQDWGLEKILKLYTLCSYIRCHIRHIQYEKLYKERTILLPSTKTDIRFPISEVTNTVTTTVTSNAKQCIHFSPITPRVTLVINPYKMQGKKDRNIQSQCYNLYCWETTDTLLTI